MEKVPLGGTGDRHRLLTQLSMLSCRAWELQQRDDQAGLKTLIHLQLLYLEQLTIDLVGSGETEVPWFLTALPVPDYHLTLQNKTILAEEPFAGLCHPKWIHANLAYMRDIDFFRNRAARPTTTARPKETATLTATQARRAKRLKKVQATAAKKD